jgi:hypothetical protein
MAPSPSPAPVLVFEPQRTRVGSFDVGIGVDAIAAGFRHDPPTALDLETAIERIEDAISALGAARAEPVLAADDPVLRQLAAAAGLEPRQEAVLATEAVERLFTRLAAASSGALAAADAVPPGRTLAAVLVLLRELMHHLRLQAVRVRPT